ncbi:putative NAD -binding domain [Rosellinia necatrix]|uniref:Putative NAD-binding domain n=1 Tax=Rosellinia necatrix TaxID=77044 RepID=A0A1W2TP91_ROSNE|nr:putative NAD -binding domain [Rosellinia necatrix]
MTDAHIQTITFFGASTGVGLEALKRTLSTGRACVALCRNPAKLSAILPPESSPNLRIVRGNAHDVTAVSACLLARDGVLVDQIVSTIGGAFIASKMTIDDPEVCRKGMAVLLDALARLRGDGAVGNPHITVCSTTGLSKFGRDIPLAMIPLYHVLLKVPHEDKVIMEDRLVASGENYTIVRPSLMVAEEVTAKEIRVGVEDPRTGRQSAAIGYTITKGDAGRWIAETLVLRKPEAYSKKIAMITT